MGNCNNQCISDQLRLTLVAGGIRRRLRNPPTPIGSPAQPAPSFSLIQLDAFQQALAEAKTIPEVKNLADQASLFHQWLRKQQAGWAALNAGLEMKLRAERRLGSMLATRDTNLHPVSWKRILPEGISHIQSHRWQRLFDIPEEHLIRYIAAIRGLVNKGLVRCLAQGGSKRLFTLQ